MVRVDITYHRLTEPRRRRRRRPTRVDSWITSTARRRLAFWRSTSGSYRADSRFSSSFVTTTTWAAFFPARLLLDFLSTRRSGFFYLDHQASLEPTKRLASPALRDPGQSRNGSRKRGTSVHPLFTGSLSFHSQLSIVIIVFPTSDLLSALSVYLGSNILSDTLSLFTPCHTKRPHQATDGLIV